jgi:hypothetical protein
MYLKLTVNDEERSQSFMKNFFSNSKYRSCPQLTYILIFQRSVYFGVKKRDERCKHNKFRMPNYSNIYVVIVPIKVKVKLALYLFTYALRYEDVWGSGSVGPPFLISAIIGCEWSASRPCRFTPGNSPR